MFDPVHDCWFLTGPTASGKTVVGIELAKRLNAEIISLDSMTIYREMDIGTAKPSVDTRAEVPHYLIDVIDPNEDYSLANYLDAAHQRVHEIRSRGRDVLFVGGTPLYLKALLRGLFEGPPADWEFRKQVRDEVARVGVDALHERLKQVDPLSAAKLPPGDVRRIIRALEVQRATGKPISHMQMHFDEGQPADACKVFVLDWSKEDLLTRIEARVDQMFADGLVDEVQSLRERYEDLSRTASQAVGYREVFELLDGKKTKTEVVERVKIRTRRFAKRQRTWFRGLSECRSIDRSEGDSTESIAEQILMSGNS